MCGIFGIFGIRAPVDGARVAEGLGALAHRGPDGHGSFIDPERRVALGHTRLAIIDPEGGAQPLANEDGSVVAVVSGELYDFVRIRTELVARGHRFRTASDSEILVHLWEERGPACLEELRGEFAFLVWDARARRLFAARDRFGVRPLVYSEHDGCLYVASEAKALFAAGIPAAWDEDALQQSFAMHYTQPFETLFRSVRQLEPGCFLDATPTGTRVGKYWDLDYVAESEERDEPGAVERVRELLEDAVRQRLVSDVPCCFQLSGGLDSSAIVGLAAKLGHRPLTAFTVSFDAPEYDELSLATESALHAGARLVPVHASRDALIDALPAAVAQAESLAVNLHLPAKLLLSRAIQREGFKVVLTGEGADEVFAGYAHLRRDLVSRDPEAVANLDASNRASAGSMLPSGAARDLGAVERALGFVPTFLLAKATLGRKLGELMTPDLVEAVDPYQRFVDHVDVKGQLVGRSRVHQSLYLWSKTALAGYILRAIGDGMEMASSVEGRVPFLDHRLFEEVRGLAVVLKINGGREKWVLRRAVADVVPERVLAREKHPFLAPPLGLPDRVHDLLARCDRVPGLDKKRTRAVLDRLPTLPEAEQRAWDPAITLATTAVLLAERYAL
jgi:asparagine synthase (glutamine-hydrolysing)